MNVTLPCIACPNKSKRWESNREEVVEECMSHVNLERLETYVTAIKKYEAR